MQKRRKLPEGENIFYRRNKQKIMHSQKTLILCGFQGVFNAKLMRKKMLFFCLFSQINFPICASVLRPVAIERYNRECKKVRRAAL